MTLIRTFSCGRRVCIEFWSLRIFQAMRRQSPRGSLHRALFYGVSNPLEKLSAPWMPRAKRRSGGALSGLKAFGLKPQRKVDEEELKYIFRLCEKWRLPRQASISNPFRGNAVPPPQTRRIRTRKTHERARVQPCARRKQNQRHGLQPGAFYTVLHHMRLEPFSFYGSGLNVWSPLKRGVFPA